MRTAWISSVVFSFIAVLGVGGFSFFLISSKSNTEISVGEAMIELADNQVFASILQDEEKTPSILTLRSAIQDSPQSNNASDDDDIFESTATSNDTDSDYEILDDDDISISELIAGEEESDTEPLLASSSNNRGEKVSRSDLLAMQSSAKSNPITEDNSFDDQEPTAKLARSEIDDIPEEMEPNSDEAFDEKITESQSTSTRDLFASAAVISATSSDNDDLVALNKFNNSHLAPVAVTVAVQSTPPKKSLNNLLFSDEEFEDSDRLEDVDDVDGIKDALDDISNDFLDKETMNNVREDVIAIIVNKENSENISISDVKNMYIDKMVSWDNGGKIVTYNLPVDSTARAIFSKKVLAMSSIQAAAEASNRVITNSSLNRTHTKRDRLVLSYVARNPSAIGYVPLKTAKSSSKVRIILTME